MLGDLNINLLFQGRQIPNGIRSYREFCAHHGLKQLINVPTRITKHSSTLLDHILTNTKEKNSQSGIIDVGLSDHQMIYCTRKVLKPKSNKKTYIKIRSLKHYTKELLLKQLTCVEFPDYSIYEDVNEAYSDFTQKVSAVINAIAPMKEICIKNKTEEWVDEEIFEGIRIRDKYFRKFKRTRLHIDDVDYRKARNRLQNIVKNKKRNFVTQKLSENMAKPKELWKSLKSLGLPSKNDASSKICLKENNEISFEPKRNAEIFKDFFANLAKDLVDKLPAPTNKFGMESVKDYYRHLNVEGNNFKFSLTSNDIVLNLLEDINPTKAVGIDNLSGRFLKDGAPVLSKPITQLCNLSIKLSVFPDDCKIAKLKPLYKKGSNVDPKNYRPISLLPLVSKIFEKIVHIQTQEYLDTHQILYKYQSGFRARHSTDTCLSLLNDKILQGFDVGKLTGMILIDLQKAFDTIDHEILLMKLECLGFSKSSINWYKSYLENRKFLVNVENEYSNPGDLTCGVPQGSILGPLIFLMYVNDMPKSVDCNLYLYADDTCLVFSDDNLKSIESSLNRNFDSLCDWFIENKLSIHFGEEKTKCIVFGTKKRLKNLDELKIRHKDIRIKQHKSVTYLGCILDDCLSGESMATKVLGKINGRLQFLYRKHSFLNSHLRRTLCNALIQPHFDYASSAWYPNLNKKFSKKVQIAQNKCIRFCLYLGNRAHIGINEFKEIKWLPTRERFQQCVCVSAYKFWNKITPSYMSEIYHSVEYRHSTRRGMFRLQQPYRNLNIGQKGLSYIGPRYWNALRSDLKSSKNTNIFKHNMKDEYFNILTKKENDVYVYY